MTLKVQEGTVLLGKYRVEKLLGHGAMGYVVAARHEGLGELHALKLLLPETLKSAEVVKRFEREARACARLKSEHAMRVYDLGRLEDGSPVMAMEYLVGDDLQCVLDQRKRLPYNEAASFVLQACEAIAEAHEVGIVHRDLKPSNLFLTRRSDGTACVKVLDFGISKSLDDETENAPKLTATNTAMGTPFYMSPEQMRNSKATDARGDIWSLGVILYEFVTGRVPFDGDNFVDISSNAVFREPAPPTQWCSGIPAEFERIVLRCLEKNPDARFSSVRELMAALRPFATASVTSNTTTGTEPDVSTGGQEDQDTGTTKGPGNEEALKPTMPAVPGAVESTPSTKDAGDQAQVFYAKRVFGHRTGKTWASTSRAGRRSNTWAILFALGTIGLAAAGWYHKEKLISTVKTFTARETTASSADVAHSVDAPSVSASAAPSAVPSATATSRSTSKTRSAPTTPRVTASATAVPTTASAAPPVGAPPSAGAKPAALSSAAVPTTSAIPLHPATAKVP